MADINYEKFVKDITRGNLHRSDLDNFSLLQKVVGLQEEVGELSQLFNKQMLYATGIDKDDLISELGDVLFYTIAIGQAYGISLQDIVKGNVDKISKRIEGKQQE